MELIVAMTYGQALFDAGCELGKLEDIKAEVIEIRNIFRDYPDYHEILCNPAIPKINKQQILRSVFEGRVSEPTMSFLFILVDKDRMNYYEGIVREFKKLVDNSKELGKGYVYSAMPLSDKQIDEIEAETSKLVRKHIRLKNRIDTSLIGGFRIMIDDKLIDGSIRNRLENLSRKIL